MHKQVRTIICGCGECQFRKNASDTCPMGTAKNAIQLWSSDLNSKSDISLEDEMAEALEDAQEESLQVRL